MRNRKQDTNLKYTKPVDDNNITSMIFRVLTFGALFYLIKPTASFPNNRWNINEASLNNTIQSRLHDLVEHVQTNPDIGARLTKLLEYASNAQKALSSRGDQCINLYNTNARLSANMTSQTSDTCDPVVFCTTIEKLDNLVFLTTDEQYNAFLIDSINRAIEEFASSIAYSIEPTVDTQVQEIQADVDAGSRSGCTADR